MTNTDDLENTPSRDRHVAAASTSSPGSAPVEICTGCGLPLIRRGPKGECLRCLIDFAFPPEGQKSPDASSHVEPAGKSALRYGHFEIATGTDGHPVELGAGAMATTYRAQDTVLHSAVALKVINQKVAEHPSARARFLREARAAAKLHHPNVASVSHYGEQDGECYYVMELVEGETLEARVRREGPLPPALVLEIGVQVARALAAAEACGVMHRDLKPSNLMLTSAQGERADGTTASTVVKVIDWGLAKAVSGESALGIDHTHGGFVGTPAFASPEQFSRAEDRRVDTRSDIYSLGVTLWYLLCGRTPFVGSTLEEIHGRQVRSPLPLEQLAAARVPGRIVTLLKSLMAVDPAARPQSARELIESLRGCQRQFPFENVPRHTRRRFHRAAVVVGLLLTLAAGALVGWKYTYPPPSTPADRSIAVLPFNNLSQDPADAFFTTGVQDEITADLAHIATLKVISPTSTKSYQPGKRDLVTIGRELGVANLLEGSAKRDGGQLIVTLRLVDLHDPTRPWTQRYERKLADVFAVQGEITRAVADRLQATLSGDEKALINRPPTTDLVAYNLYLRSREGPELWPDETALRHSAEEKIGLLEQAVARDPKFFLAYCLLARQHDYAWTHNDGATPEELAVDHRTLAEVALQKARHLQPEAGEVHLATAQHLYLTNKGSEQTVIEAELALRALPNNAVVATILADIYCEAGRWEDAVHSYERAYALNPRGSLNCYDLALTYESLRRYEDYDRMMGITIPLSPDESKLSFTLARTRGPMEARADLNPMRTALADLHADDHPDNEVMMECRILIKLYEHDADGLSALLVNGPAVIVEAGFRYPKAWFAALAARMRGDQAGAQSAFADARVVAEKAVADKPRSALRLSLLAMIDAGLGRKEDAVREARRACDMQPYTTHATYAPLLHCNLAVVYAWTDQRDLAIATLADAVEHPAGENLLMQPTYGDFKLNPLWDPLRTDPRFAALAERLAPAAKH